MIGVPTITGKFKKRPGGQQSVVTEFYHPDSELMKTAVWAAFAAYYKVFADEEAKEKK